MTWEDLGHFARNSVYHTNALAAKLLRQLRQTEHRSYK